MEITIKEFIKGAQEAQGLTVIIDVFRAFSTACYAFDSGINRLLDVATPEEAFALRDKLKAEVIIAGEQDEKKPAGFDYGNSPTEMLTGSVAGKTMIHCTTAGTKGIINAAGATEILGAGLVNAGAVASYISMIRPEKVTLVAMGYRALESAEEDMLCARYIKDVLEGRESDISKETEALRKGSGSRFFNPANLDFSPPTDFFLCTDLNRFNFVLRAVITAGGYAEILRISMDH
ncbi:MAG: 2-phosphosulfolactate phosphatase [Bacteroidales bacterium]|jgi:2-phosphosulfolactate phosphatase|nr:2-phosphosulfolactate phosphatase [Bacteroidales bacterium]MDX9925974.1 2-phosphosulfolactate phosphatase [Bacteroidales bacterium]HNX83197.1 2-phosphosulfolactate phosphatase [Bacteroidales bacterium]HOC47430.1 2-phosphosulfolactate phosphatase [Bacteroidales bacterium]HPS96686.1 2-phosphosulfolactate phosphatase [Bacteroidales bacterium]